MAICCRNAVAGGLIDLSSVFLYSELCLAENTRRLRYFLSTDWYERV